MDREFAFVDLEKVDPPGDAFRDLIDPEEVRELAESIRSQGMHEPIVLRPVNGRYETVMGHRRYLAHRLLGEVKIMGIIRSMTDEEVFEARAVENDQRVDLNPIERARVYLRFREKFGLSNRQIAQKMGRSPGVVDKYLKLLEIPVEFQAAVAHKKLSIQVALELNKIEDEAFRNLYFTSAVENGITVEVAETWVNEWRKSKAGAAYAEAGGGAALGSGETPTVIYGTCFACQGPVEVTKVQYIPLCPDCVKEVKGALKPGS
jgi:ParB family transcriptional regulator, chromosome partitioning protein